MQEQWRMVLWRHPPHEPPLDIDPTFARLADAGGSVATVATVAESAEVVAELAAARSDGALPLVVTSDPFSPPAADIDAPVIPVIGWPYDRIPDEARMPRWSHAIALEPHSAEVMRRHSPTTRLFVLSPESFARPLPPRGDRDALVVNAVGSVIDTRELEITDVGIRHLCPETRFESPPWDGRPFQMRFSSDSGDRGRLVGFYNSEVWGTWSRSRDPWVVLPRTVTGDVRLSLDAHGFAANAGRRIGVSLGGSRGSITLPEQHGHIELVLRGVKGGNVLQFHDLDIGNSGTSTDIRTLGIALGSVRFSRQRLGAKVRDRIGRLMPVRPSSHSHRSAVELSGTILISEIDPHDPLTDWGRLITAFCQEFRHRDDLTLVLRMPHATLADYFGELQLILHRIGPFRCRVVVIDGDLPDHGENELWARADVAVGASGGAAECARLWDAAVSGTRIVAARHSAYRSLPIPDGHRIAWTKAPAEWPLDTRSPLVVCATRLDPDSLRASMATAVGAARGSRRNRAHVSSESPDTAALRAFLAECLAETRSEVADAAP